MSECSDINFFPVHHYNAAVQSRGYSQKGIAKQMKVAEKEVTSKGHDHHIC